MSTVPKGAKKPSDHQPAKDAAPQSLTVTVRGHDYTVMVEALDDFELLDDLNELDQNDNPTRLPSILRRLLGDQSRAALDTLRDPDTGRVSIDAGADFVTEIMEGLDPN